jgi:DNA-binding LacI/PurR family transcriptional regulator
MALGVMRAAQRLEKRIPEDLAVVGFDDIPESPFYSPPLTTVRQDLYKLGQVAVQTFLQLRDAEQGGELNIPILLQPQLVVREST